MAGCMAGGLKEHTTEMVAGDWWLGGSTTGCFEIELRVLIFVDSCMDFEAQEGLND